MNIFNENSNFGQDNQSYRFFSRFERDAKDCLLNAHKVANNLGSSITGVEHLFVSILDFPDSYIVNFLSSRGINIENLKSELNKKLRIQSPISSSTLNISSDLSAGLNSLFKYSIAKVDLNMISEMILKSGNSLVNDTLANLVNNKDSNKESESEFDIEKYGTDLSKLAEEHKLSPVIGRDEEVDRVIEILSRKSKNNPILLGEPGVGKTAIAEGLAMRIANGNVPEKIKSKRIFALDVNSLVSGTKYRGSFEENIKKLIDSLKEKEGEIILFIDEIHTIVGAGGMEGQLDIANVLKPALARGEFATIGATTLKEYKKYFATDAALERRFQPVNVLEPSIEEAIEILNGLKDTYEKFHNVTISQEAIEQTVKLSSKYIQNRFLPDKAIDIIDEACAAKSFLINDNNLTKELEEAVGNQDYEKAAEIKTEIARSKNYSVWVEDIKNIIEKIAKVPILDVSQDDAKKFLDLENLISKNVIGQKDAINKVSDCIRRSKAGLNNPDQPIGTFLFMGPTGVGKTELVKALASEMFGSKDSIIRLDMSEFMEQHSVSKIIGAPAGYVGYNEGGDLIDKVSNKPYSIILLDEIEKAHTSVLNIFLQMMDEGRLTDSKGKTVSFKNTIIIATSNVGAEFMLEEKDSNQENRFKIDAALKRSFKPEFLNRFDEIIQFESLSKDQILEIVDINIRKLNLRLKDKNLELVFDEESKKFLADQGYNPIMGVRPLNRVFKREVESVLAGLILKDKIEGKFKVIKKDSACNLEFEKISN